MEENNLYKQQDDLIRSRFEGAEALPSANAWDTIEARLDKKDRKRPGFIFWLSGIVLLMFTSGTIWYFYQNAELKKQLSGVNVTAKTTLAPKNSADRPANSSVNKTGDVSAIPVANSTPNNSSNAQNEKNETPSNTSDLAEYAPKINTNKKTSENGLNPDEKKSAENKKEQKSVSENKNTGSENNSIALIHPSAKATKTNEKKNMDPKATDAKKTGSSGNKFPADKNENASSANQETGSTKANTLKDSPENSPPDPAKAEALAAEQKLKEKQLEEQKKKEEDQKKEEQVKAEAEQKFILQQKLKADSTALADAKKEKKDSAEVKKDSVKSLALAPKSNSKTDSIKANNDQFRKIISLYFSPDYYQNTVKDNSDQFAGKETRVPRYSAGVKFSYAVLDKLFVRLGVSYSELKQQLGENKITFERYQTEPYVFHSSLGDMPVDMATMKDGFSPMAPSTITKFSLNYTYKQSVQFINIPLEVKYGFMFGRFGLGIMLGAQAQYAYQSHGELQVIKEHATNVITYNNLDINKLTFAGTGGLSIDFKLNKRFSIFAEPNARINFTPFGKSSEVRSSPMFFGLNAGLSFHF